jgi:hypothetical protein
MEMSGVIRSRPARIMHPLEIGRRKKILKLPLERMRDCLKALSNMGVRTKARIKGAASY